MRKPFRYQEAPEIPAGAKLERLVDALADLKAWHKEYEPVIGNSYYYANLVNELDNAITKETVIQIKSGRKFA